MPPSVSKGSTSALQVLLRRVTGRIRRHRAERGAWRGAFWGAALAAAVLAGKATLGDAALPIALALAGTALATGALTGACRRVSAMDAACLADRVFALQDRVATALEWHARTPKPPLAEALLADATARVEELLSGGYDKHRLMQRHMPREARLLALPLLIAAVLGLAPPLRAPDSWLKNDAQAPGEQAGSQASFLDRMKNLGADLLRSQLAARAEESQRTGEQGRAKDDAAQFKDRADARRTPDFASFARGGDERLRLLERSDRLPDLQSDFASSRYRMLLRKSQELASGNGANQPSAAKLAQILREMERLGTKDKDGDWNEDVQEGLEALEDGQTGDAMDAMQSALGKMRASEERQRAGKMLKNAPQGNGEEGGRSGSDSRAANEHNGSKGYSDGKGGSSKGTPTARLRSTPNDIGVQGQRSGRMPSYETQALSRPGSLSAQLQYRGEIGQYRRQMEDALAREQVPRDYRDQVRDYFRSLTE